jgi:hypothetical protein
VPRAFIAASFAAKFGPIRLGIAIANLTLGKNTLHKANTEALDRISDARHFRNIDAGANDHDF